MNRPLLAFAGLMAAGATAVGVYVAAPGGGEEEAVQQIATPTSSSTPASSAPVPSSSTKASPTSSTVPTPAATLTYTDPTYGYSFEYPATWYLVPPKDPGGLVYLYSYSLASVKPEDAGKPVPIDQLKVIFWVAKGVDKPVDQWLAEEAEKAAVEQNLPTPIVVSQAPVTLGGRPGLTQVTEADGVKDASYYIPIGGGQVFVINAGPADSLVWPLFDPVLASLQFSP
jgi:hypothetical protein